MNKQFKIALSIGFGGLAVVGLSTTAQASTTTSTGCIDCAPPTSTPSKPSNPTSPSPGVGAGVNSSELNVSNNSNPNSFSDAQSTGVFSNTNLGGTSIAFNQDEGSNSVQIGAARCPSASINVVGSYSGSFADNDFQNVNGVSVAAVASIPLPGKNGKYCSEYLALQVDDLSYSIGFKSVKACLEIIKESGGTIRYFDSTMMSEAAANICNRVAMQYYANAQPQVKVIEKEVIKEVPVHVPVHPEATGVKKG